MSETRPLPPESSPRPSSEGGDASPAIVSGRRLSRALEVPLPHSGAATDEIRAAIRDVVDELKTLGLPPERVLVRVKSVIGSFPGERDSEARRLVLQQVITWCIEAYYGSDAGRPATIPDEAR